MSYSVFFFNPDFLFYNKVAKYFHPTLNCPVWEFENKKFFDFLTVKNILNEILCKLMF